MPWTLLLQKSIDLSLLFAILASNYLPVILFFLKRSLSNLHQFFVLLLNKHKSSILSIFFMLEIFDTIRKQFSLFLGVMICLHSLKPGKAFSPYALLVSYVGFILLLSRSVTNLLDFSDELLPKINLGLGVVCSNH
jgi:hypothetical protein